MFFSPLNFEIHLLSVSLLCLLIDGALYVDPQLTVGHGQMAHHYKSVVKGVRVYDYKRVRVKV